MGNRSTLTKLRQQLQSFDDPEIDALVLDNFPEVYDKFSRGLRKDEKINLLLAYLRRHPSEYKKLQILTQPNMPIQQIGPEPPDVSLISAMATLTTPYLDRNSKFSEVLASVLEKKHRITALVGEPGTGKTHLAIRLATQAWSLLPDGVVWISHQPTAALWETALLQAFKVSLANHREENRKATLLSAVHTKQAVIILDDVETLSHIAFILTATNSAPEAKGSYILLTTRNAEFDQCPNLNTIRINAFTENESLELLEKILHLSWSESEREDAIVLSRKLGYLPIAIDIVARRIRQSPHSSISRFLFMMQENTSHLDYLEVDGHSVRAVYHLCFERLQSAEQRCLLLISLFDSCQFDFRILARAIEAPVDRVSRSLGILYRLSLVQQAGEENYYRVHMLLKEFVRSQFREQTVQFSPSVASIYTELSGQANDNMDDARFYQLGASFWSLELVNVLGVTRGMLTHYPQNTNLILPLLESLKTYLVRIGEWQVCKELLDQARESYPDDSFNYSRILWLLADVYKQQGTDISRALALYAEAVPPLAREYKSRKEFVPLGVLYRQLGDAYRVRGLFDKALEYYEDAVDMLDQSDNIEELGETWSSIAEAHLRLHNLPQAGRYCTKARTVAVSLQDSFEIFICDRIASEIALLEGNYDASTEAIERALSIVEDTIRSDRAKLWVLIIQAELFRRECRFGDSLTVIREALRVAKKQIATIGIGLCHLILGRLFGDCGKTDYAANHLFIASTVFRNGGSLIHEAETYLELARLHLVLGNQHQSSLYGTKASRLASEYNYTYVQSEIANIGFDSQQGEAMSQLTLPMHTILAVSSAVAADSGFDTLDALSYAIENKFEGFQAYVNQDVIGNPGLRSRIRSMCNTAGIRLIAHAPATLQPEALGNESLNLAIKDLLSVEDKARVVYHYDENIGPEQTLECMEVLTREGITVCLENYFIGGVETSERSFRDYLSLLTRARDRDLDFLPVLDIPRLYFEKTGLVYIALDLVEEAFDTFMLIGSPIILHLIDVPDSSQARESWCPLGQGFIPYGNIFERLKYHNIPVYMIVLEYEDKTNPLQSRQALGNMIL